VKNLSQKRVFVTREIFEEAVKILKEVAEVEVFHEADKPISRELLIKKIKNVDGILTLITDKIDKGIIDAAKNLCVISNFAVGYNNIDIKAATERGIMVTNTPGVLTETTADLAFGLLISIARRIPEGDRFIRSKKWIYAWGPKMFVGSDVNGKTLGIVGLGRIGVAVAKRAKCFNLKVIYYDAIRDLKKEKTLGVEFTPFEELLKQSDFVTLHVPLNEDTRHLISKKELQLMKKTAYLINSSRGPVVDQDSLFEALDNKLISGASLDVFEEEPIDPNSPLLNLENIVLTPHIGSASFETRKKMATTAAKNLVVALNGEEPPNLVNQEVLELK
jgi:glyoxylate reductase